MPTWEKSKLTLINQLVIILVDGRRAKIAAKNLPEATEKAAIIVLAATEERHKVGFLAPRAPQLQKS